MRCNKIFYKNGFPALKTVKEISSNFQSNTHWLTRYVNLCTKGDAWTSWKRFHKELIISYAKHMKYSSGLPRNNHGQNSQPRKWRKVMKYDDGQAAVAKEVRTGVPGQGRLHSEEESHLSKPRGDPRCSASSAHEPHLPTTGFSCSRSRLFWENNAETIVARNRAASLRACVTRTELCVAWESPRNSLRSTHARTHAVSMGEPR